MKIKIIGGSGFVGTRLIDLLKKNDLSCSNLDKNSSRFYNEITKIVDIRDANLLKSALIDTDVVILLAAEHRDDVSPKSLYYDVNVQGTINVLKAMEDNNINHIIFTSSVAVYGLNKINPNEQSPQDPFNDYGKSKWQAEEVLRKWYHNNPNNKSLTIIRPTVIFGERNRGNVYNLLKQIASGKFMMVGKGHNKKSMAYIGNIVAFIKYQIDSLKQGYQVFNYIDKPDYTMNELVQQVEISLQKKIPSVKIPYFLGLFAGYCFDILKLITNKKYAISAVRVKKFCATTQFDATKLKDTNFKAPYTLSESLDKTLKFEFQPNVSKDDIVFETE